MVLFLLTACNIQEEELNKSSDDFYLSNIFFELEYPEEVALNEEFSVKVYMTNNLMFPVTLSSVSLPFSDFKFAGEKDEFVIYPNAEVLAEETKVFEYKMKRNMESFGSGIISSLLQFELSIEDPEYGSKDLRRNENFVLTFI